jgi:pyridoxal 5'-phosphate synthase glutaminase subunit Pdx2
MKIGVLALQGDFAEHINKLSGIGVDTAEVRLPADLEGLAGLILPGGESTTIGKLAEDFGLVDPLRFFCKTHAVWGTCAGAIFLARDAGRRQPLLGVMDISVERNAFGRQVDSFEADLDLPALAATRGFRGAHARCIHPSPRDPQNGRGRGSAGAPAGRHHRGRPPGPLAGHLLPHRDHRGRPAAPVFPPDGGIRMMEWYGPSL